MCKGTPLLLQKGKEKKPGRKAVLEAGDGARALDLAEAQQCLLPQ